MAESEFGLGPGMIPKQRRGVETEVEQVWEIFATNPAGTDGTQFIDPDQVGKPRPWDVVKKDAR